MYITVARFVRMRVERREERRVLKLEHQMPRIRSFGRRFNLVIENCTVEVGEHNGK